MSELSTRLHLRRKELGLSQEELAQRMGYRSKSSITKLEKGINDLPQSKVEELAAALETTPAYLLGLDAPCPPPGFEPLPAMTQVPLIGSIACGTPITAEQNIERYIGVPAAWRADFALTCHGDSMSPAGIPGHKLHNSIGVMKAYSSCVGDGPFTAELAMTEEEKHDLREAGHEYGAATGRPRRVGPIDLVASHYGVFCQGCDEVALTLLDVLDYMEKIPVVTGYKLTDGTITKRFPMGMALDTAQPVVEYLPGWHCDITAARKWEDLPQEARDYVEYLEKAIGCKITYISVGAEREAYIHHNV